MHELPSTCLSMHLKFSKQKSVDRLGRAIEAAEDEMEATLKRTTDIHKSHLRQKELELTEQQKLLQVRIACFSV